jgi:hypothetical protein
MKIAEKQVLYRKTIGSVESRPVVEIATIGGLRVVGVPEKGKLKILGVGSHRAVARFLAKKAMPSLKISELEKSEDLKYEDFKDKLPFWQTVVDRMNK